MSTANISACLYQQDSARYHAHEAMFWWNYPSPRNAIIHQEAARHAYLDAWWHLSRLLGAES